MTSSAITTDRVIIDTDVFSFIFRGDSRADFFRSYLIRKTLAIAFMTVAELYYGAYKDNWGPSRTEQLENALRNYVVIPYDGEVTRLWARVKRQCEERGHTILHADCWIAACALRHGCALATNNGRDFKEVEGLTIISPGFG